MGKYSNARVDRAAGGVVLDIVAGSPVVLVVHRPRYDDWTLPKGHVDDGETWDQTALREVLEETATEAEIVGPPTAIGYMIDDAIPKVVVFYPMAPCLHQQSHEVDANEVDTVDWWPVERAATELSYLDERRVLVELAERTLS